LLVDVAGVTLSGALTSSHYSDCQHMGSWKQDPVSLTTLTNFGRLTRWQSSQALHKAQLHEERKSSSTAFQFLQRLSIFPQRLSTFREIRENLSMAASI
jgi:hypothetical protein